MPIRGKKRQLINIRLRPPFIYPRDTRARGIGRQLMERLIEECRAGGYHALIACITEGNEASYSLHEKLGFRKVSHFEKVGLKFGRWLDVVDYELIIKPNER